MKILSETIFVHQMGGYISRILSVKYPEIKGVNIKMIRPDSSGFGMVIYSDKPLTERQKEEIRKLIFKRFFEFQVRSFKVNSLSRKPH